MIGVPDRVARGAVVALLVGALAGCTSIPVNGPVVTPPALQQDDPGSLAFIPNGPVDGADPQAIVTGFVAAATEGHGYTVARKFMSRAGAEAWDPGARVLLNDAESTTRVVGDGRVELDTRPTAEVDASGQYGPPEDRTPSLVYQLAKVNGQWRITSAPNGVILPRSQFQRTFQAETLQYFDTTHTRLVPDLRWYPNRSDLRTAVVRSLLAPPTAVLTGVVAPTAPSGSTVGLVSRNGGVLTVALAVPGVPLTRVSTDRIQQQLLRTFMIPQPAGLRLVVNGVVAPTARALVTPQPDQRPYVLAGNRFGTLSDQGVVEEPLLGKRIAAQEPTAVTISTRQKLAVVLDDRGRAVMVPAEGDVRVVDSRPGLADPSLDQRGWAWTVPKTDPSGLLARKGKALARIDLPLSGSTVKSIEVSPDGTRLLVLLETDRGPRAFVVGILRAADGAPTGLTADRSDITLTSGGVVDATWVDDAGVAVLTTDDAGQSVTVQALGAPASAPSRLSNATSLVGTTTADNLLARLQNGQLSTPGLGNLWQVALSTTVKVAVLAVQR